MSRFIRRATVPRLNTNQFLALRSIAREPWDMQWRRIQWRFNGKWVHVFRDGVRAPLDSIDGIGGHYGYDDVYKRAWDAAWELDEQGLVEVVTERCCHSESCHRNDRHEFRLTSRGSALLQKANAVSQRVVADATLAKHSIPAAVMTSSGETWWHKAASLLERLRA